MLLGLSSSLFVTLHDAFGHVGGVPHEFGLVVAISDMRRFILMRPASRSMGPHKCFAGNLNWVAVKK